MGVNKDLGLPFGDGMEKVAICFDVDGTLITDSKIHTRIVDMVNAFADFKNVDVIVWSGGGKQYVETIVNRLGNHLIMSGNLKLHSKFEHEEIRKRYKHIIAIDDVQDTRLGDINLIVRNK